MRQNLIAEKRSIVEQLWSKNVEFLRFIHDRNKSFIVFVYTFEVCFTVVDDFFVRMICKWLETL